MYSAVLMMALTAGGETADFGRNRCHGCAASCGAVVCSSSYGCASSHSCARRGGLFSRLRNRCHGCASSCSVAVAPNPNLAPTYGSVHLKTGFLPDPHAVNLTAGGPYQVIVGGKSMYIAAAPDYRVHFDAGSKFPRLTFYAESAADTTLLILGPDGYYYGDDDSGKGLNPGIEFAPQRSGTYLIWVGTYGPSLAPATLKVSELQPKLPW